MKKIVIGGFAALALIGAAAPAWAQSYNNQALENYYRSQDQQRENAWRMQQQQHWMQEQQRETYRDLYNQRPFRGW